MTNTSSLRNINIVLLQLSQCFTYYSCIYFCLFAFFLNRFKWKQRIFLQSYASCHLMDISVQEWRFPFQATFASVELSNGTKYENFNCFVEVLLRLSPSLSLAHASQPPLAKRFDSFFHHSALYLCQREKDSVV